MAPLNKASSLLLFKKGDYILEDYKSNSHKSKKENAESIPEKRVNPVISGQAKTKKKSGFRKIADALIVEDAANVKTYIFNDVVIPSIKKTINDLVTNSLEMFLFGKSGGTKTTSASKISYRSYYEGKRTPTQDRSTRYGDGLDYDDIEFETRGDAESVLSSMYDVIDRYNVVSVGDFYDLANIQTSNYNLNNYGWTNLNGARVVSTGNGYVIRFPTRAIPIN